MAVKIYKDGAFQDVGTLRRNVGGAWADCDAAYKYEDGVWKEVWSVMDKFSLFALPQKGFGNVNDNGRSMTFFQSTNGASATLPNSGYIDIRIDGEWHNPTIEFAWEGGLTYWNTSYTRGYTNIAGEISVQGNWSTTGSSGLDNIGSVTVGQNGSYAGEAPTYKGTFLKNLSSGRTYNRIRVVITPRDWSNTALFDATKEITIKNFFIAQKQIGFPDELNFDRG